MTVIGRSLPSSPSSSGPSTRLTSDLACVQAHDAPVSRLSWAHPEFGTILACCSFDKTVKIWEEGGMTSARGGEGNTGSKWHERAVLSESRVTGASVRALEFGPRHFGLKLVRGVLFYYIRGGCMYL